MLYICLRLPNWRKVQVEVHHIGNHLNIWPCSIIIKTFLLKKHIFNYLSAVLCHSLIKQINTDSSFVQKFNCGIIYIG